jgi:hypothetical protein
MLWVSSEQILIYKKSKIIKLFPLYMGGFHENMELKRQILALMLKQTLQLNRSY